MSYRTVLWLLCVAGFLCLAVVSQAAPPVLWEAPSQCEANFLANYWHCKPLSTTLALDKPSETDDEWLRALPFENSLQLVFRCQSSAPVALAYQVGQTSATLAQTPGPTVQTLVSPVLYSGGMYRFDLTPDPQSIVLPECSLKVTGNLTTLQLEPAKGYANGLLARMKERAAWIGQLDEAQTLPAKWIVAKNMGQTLEASRAFKALQKEQLLSQQQTLTAIPEAQRTEAQVVQLHNLGDRIDELTLELDDLALLRDELKTAMPDNDVCSVGTGNDEVFCLTKVGKAKAAVEAALSADGKSASKFLVFLQAEVTRLQQTSAGFGQAMAQTLQQLQIQVGAN